MFKLYIAIFFVIFVIALNTSLAEEIAIIVNEDNGTKEISLADLKKIFKAERSFWGNGKKIKLITRPIDSIETKVLLKKIYELKPKDYEPFWLEKIYRGKTMKPPTIIRSASVVNALVDQLPGAIASIEAGQISKLAGIKILKINGKMPGDEGYPLKTKE